MAIRHQTVGKRERVAQRPAIALRQMDLARQRAHRAGAGVVEAEVVLAAEIAAGVEVAGGTGQRHQGAPGRGGRRGYSFLRMKHFR